MKLLIVPISLGLLCSSFATSPAVPVKEQASVTIGMHTKSGYTFSSFFTKTATAVYTSLHLDELGLSRIAFDLAWKGYAALSAEQKTGSRYLSICDFSQSSRNKRLYIIDVEQQKLLFQTWVAHGKNSGAEFATRFSNKPESLQSSLGFYTTGSTYIGKHGLSLKMQGLEPGINDKAMERAIVIHGADYVSKARVNAGGYIGRSWGCPAVSSTEANSIINTIKNGSCLFIYHPTKEYTERSKILND